MAQDVKVTLRSSEPSVFDYDAEKVQKLLQLEASGQMSPDMQAALNKLRQTVKLPPPILGMKVADIPMGGSALVQQRAAEAFPKLPTPPKPEDPPWSVAEVVERSKAPAKKFGMAAIDTLTDPEALAQTAGGLISKSGPIAAVGAGVGGAAVSTGREFARRAAAGEEQDPTSLVMQHTIPSFIEGVAGETVGRGLTGLLRAPRGMHMTPEGRTAEQFYKTSGKKGAVVPLHQLVDNPVTNVMGNIAEYGPGGKARMATAHQFRSDVLHESMIKEAERAGGGNLTARTLSRTGIDPAAPGIAVQKNIDAQLDKVSIVSGFKDFVDDFGDIAEDLVDPTTGTPMLDSSGRPLKGPKLRSLMKSRSQALMDGRAAQASTDPAARQVAQEAAERASRLDDKIMSLLPDQTAKDRFRVAGAAYRSEMERLANPMAYNLRLKTKGDEVLQKILADKLPTYAPLAEGRALSNEELAKQVMKALTPDAQQQLRGDLLYQLTNASIDPESGFMNYKLMNDLVSNLSDGTRSVLFGGNADRAIDQAMTLLKNEVSKTEAGRLFIAIRQPGAAMTAAGGLATGNVGAGLVGAATILMMPQVFSRVMLSPVARKLLVSAASAPTGIRQHAAFQKLMTYITQAGLEDASEPSEGETRSMIPGFNNPIPGTIPPPPTTGTP